MPGSLGSDTNVGKILRPLNINIIMIIMSVLCWLIYYLSGTFTMPGIVLSVLTTINSVNHDKSIRKMNIAIILSCGNWDTESVSSFLS